MSERFDRSEDKKQKIQEIFRQTYFISQGMPKLQSMLFDWVAMEKFVSLEDYKLLRIDWLENFVSPSIHHPAGYFATNQQKTDPFVQAESFHSSITHEIIDPNINPEGLTSSILTYLLSIDIMYQILERPNRKQLNEVKPDDANDIHKSYIRHYVIHDNYKSKPFSLLFNLFRNMNLHNLLNERFNITQFTIPNQGDDERDLYRGNLIYWSENFGIGKQLNVLAKLWEQNHPGEKFFENKIN